MIIVNTCRISFAASDIVYQTSSCGCGPQPYIKAAMLEKEVAWSVSKFRKKLTEADNAKDKALADQDVVTTVLRITPAVSEGEKALILDALKDHLGPGLIINFF